MSTRLCALLGWLALTGLTFGQTDSARPAPTKGFTVAVLQGDGVVNVLPRPLPTHVSIRVSDSKGDPIRNAVAVFESPEAGASATFPDGSVIKVLLTDTKGEATVDLKSNEVPGKYEPTVTVNYLGQSSIVRLHQENAHPYVAPTSTKRGFFSRMTAKKAVIIAGAAGAAVAVAVLARGGGSRTAPSNNGGITVTPGTGTVGGGQ